MANVTIDHPSTVGYAVVSQEAFDQFYEDLGWVIVPDDPPVLPSSESPANVGDINAAVALLPDIDDVRPPPVWQQRTSGDITTTNTGFAYVDFDPTGSASARNMDLVIPDVVAGTWVRVQPSITCTNSTAVSVGFRFSSIVSGAVVNSYVSPVWTVFSTYFGNVTAPYSFQLVSGDISGGSCRLRLQYSALGTRVLSAGTLAPARVEAQVIG